MDADWVRDLRDQCVAAQIPFFFKQWGGVLPAKPSFPGRPIARTRRLISASDRRILCSCAYIVRASCLVTPILEQVSW
jgi:hypothetical protein